MFLKYFYTVYSLTNFLVKVCSLINNYLLTVLEVAVYIYSIKITDISTGKESLNLTQDSLKPTKPIPGLIEPLLYKMFLCGVYSFQIYIFKLLNYAH